MRINDKHLAAFACSNSPIDREGYMLKRGEVNKANQKRWFVLKGNLLFYFEKKGDSEPIGVIVLEGCCVVPDQDDAGGGRSFSIAFGQTYGGRNYMLTCDTNADMLSWVRAVSCASYDYMKTLVQELQKQLEEINLAERSKSFAPQAVSEHHVDVPVGLDAASLFQTNQVQSSDVLVDDLLGLNSPGPQQQSGRMNPFDKELSLGDIDESRFENTVTVACTGDRSFEEMHQQFGRKILRLLPIDVASTYH